MNTTEIKKKLKELKSNTTNVSKELNELENVLHDSEDILFAASTLFNGSTWLVICTNERIILLDKGMFKGTSKEEINYKNIWNLDAKKGIIFGTIIIKTSLRGKTFKLEQLIKSDIDRFLDVIEKQKVITTNQKPIVEIKENISIQPIIEKQEPKLYISFNVAGVTQVNDTGKDIQSILQKEGEKYCTYNGIDLYDGMTAKEIKEEDSEVAEFTDVFFDDSEVFFIPEPTNEYDKNAIKVYIKYFENRFPLHIGYVPKEKIQQLKKIIEKNTHLSIEGQYVGGKIKEPVYDPSTDKTEMEIAELMLGIEISIFYRLD